MGSLECQSAIHQHLRVTNQPARGGDRDALTPVAQIELIGQDCGGWPDANAFERLTQSVSELLIFNLLGCMGHALEIRRKRSPK
jgi:hypothetical protein